VHTQASFESFRPSNAEQARAQQVAREFALKYPQSRGYILSGPVGTGKTHLLSATLKHLALEVGARVAYVEISLLYAQIRRGFQDGRSGGEIIQPLSQVDVLAIDELGKGRGSAFELDTLDELIARRYNAGRVTLFATNYSLKSPEDRAQRGYVSTEAMVDATKESKLLCDRVGDRIYSRLCEMCEFVEFPSSTADQRRTRSISERVPNGPPRR
jgi:DNA replication protein DnaC